jgi:protein-tyrosine phosphatase
MLAAARRLGLAGRDPDGAVPRRLTNRHLDWEGCVNVRDLGGLPTAGGRETRRGALVRADSVEGLTDGGWAALWAHGLRTVIDLRNEDERGPDAAPRPEGLTTLELPLDAIDDSEFWDRWATGPEFATPLYYGPHLDRFPERSARVIAAIAAAPPGGVLFHCVGGRDRTGQIAMLVLALAGVGSEEIAADYVLSSDRLSVRYARLGEPDQGHQLEEFLAARGTSAREVIVATVASLDTVATLRRGGLRAADLTAVCDRLLLGDTDGHRA